MQARVNQGRGLEAREERKKSRQLLRISVFMGQPVERLTAGAKGGISWHSVRFEGKPGVGFGLSLGSGLESGTSTSTPEMQQSGDSGEAQSHHGSTDLQRVVKKSDPDFPAFPLPLPLLLHLCAPFVAAYGGYTSI